MIKFEREGKKTYQKVRIIQRPKSTDSLRELSLIIVHNSATVAATLRSYHFVWWCIWANVAAWTIEHQSYNKNIQHNVVCGTKNALKLFYELLHPFALEELKSEKYYHFMLWWRTQESRKKKCKKVSFISFEHFSCALLLLIAHQLIKWLQKYLSCSLVCCFCSSFIFSQRLYRSSKVSWSPDKSKRWHRFRFVMTRTHLIVYPWCSVLRLIVKL